MQVQNIQNSNFNTTFGATIEINNNYRKMKKPVVNFIKKEFSEKTKDISGHLGVSLNGEIVKGTYLPDAIHYFNDNGFAEEIMLRSPIELSEPKEALLDKFCNVLKGFSIRENAQNKINALKKEIVEISHKANCDSEEKFKQTFSIYDKYVKNSDIDAKDSSSFILINRQDV